MELRFLKPKETAQIAKLTVHKTGKIGLSKGAMDLLKVEQNRFAKFGYDHDDRLHLVMQEEADENTFSVNKAGQYYYISAKTLLDDMGIDYGAADTVIFDIKMTDHPNYYRLMKRILLKRR